MKNIDLLKKLQIIEEFKSSYYDLYNTIILKFKNKELTWDTLSYSQNYDQKYNDINKDFFTRSITHFPSRLTYVSLNSDLLLIVECYRDYESYWKGTAKIEDIEIFSSEIEYLFENKMKRLFQINEEEEKNKKIKLFTENYLKNYEKV